MRKSRFTTEQIIGFIKQVEAGDADRRVVSPAWLQRGDIDKESLTDRLGSPRTS